MKSIVVFLFLPIASFSQKSPNCTIKGVVTYFFNKYQGDKPDIGAEVYALDSGSAKKFDEKIVDSFHYANFYRNIVAGYKAINEDIPMNVQESVKEYNADNEEYFKSLDERNYAQFLIVKRAEDAYQATVDGAGNFVIALKPSTYYIFIKSNNRKDMTISEYGGKLYFKKARIKSEQTLNVSTKFDIN